MKPSRVGLRFSHEGIKPTVDIGMTQYVTKVSYEREEAEKMVEEIKRTKHISAETIEKLYKQDSM